MLGPRSVPDAAHDRQTCPPVPSDSRFLTSLRRNFGVPFHERALTPMFPAEARPVGRFPLTCLRIQGLPCLGTNVVFPVHTHDTRRGVPRPLPVGGATRALPYRAFRRDGRRRTLDRPHQHPQREATGRAGRASEDRRHHRRSPFHGITFGVPAHHALPVEQAREDRTRCDRQGGKCATGAATTVARSRAWSPSSTGPVPDAEARLRRIAAILLEHATRAASTGRRRGPPGGPVGGNRIARRARRRRPL